MKTTLKWIGMIVGGLAALLITAVIILYLIGNSRLNSSRVTARPVAVPTDAAAMARGEHLVNVVSDCIGCHGPNLEGRVFLDEAPIGYIPSTNLTNGQGGIGGSASDEDWVRAIRHGVGRDGRVLGAMPSNYYTHLSDEDLGAIIAYVKSVPPVDNDLGQRNISFPGTIIFGVLGYNDLPAALIDHDNAGGSVKPPEGATAEYGDYLARIAACGECHGANLEGRPPEAAEQGPPAGPNLSPGGNLSQWTQQDFATAMRTGQTPDGRQLSDEMPWPYYAGMTDDELQAIWLYLQNLPAH